MQKQHVYVISDVHLGGMSVAEDPEGVGFQLCPPDARRRLARFVHHLRARHPAGDAQLVINGDFVDFLAEETAGVNGEGEQLPAFEAFTPSQRRAVEKLRRVVHRADEGAREGERIFEALGAFLAEGNRLDLLLGNHDIELSLPDCRRYLVSLLTGDRPARLSLTYDGEALDLGPLLIEHGNRYDGWNAVAHGELRAWRARATRGEPPYEFTPPPGSRLVTRIMNPLKRRFRFIDLLKPENEAVVPLMVALEPDALGEIDKLLACELYAVKERVEVAPGRLSEEESYVAAGVRKIAAPSPPAADELAGEVFDVRALEATRRLLAAEHSKWSDARLSEQETQIASGAGDWLKSTRSLFRLYRAPPAERLRRLREALLGRADAIGATFELDREEPRYLEAARRLARGGRTVVFGHTHLVKRIALAEGLYLNTGTWCPTVSLPPQFFDAAVPDAEVLPALGEFVRDLCENRTDPWLRLQTAYAHVIVDGDRAVGEVCEYGEDGSVKTL
jgi:UDP-2,3-diacylglucosamine pyrophosphatase LpxH